MRETVVKEHRVEFCSICFMVENPWLISGMTASVYMCTLCDIYSSLWLDFTSLLWSLGMNETF
jgi:hypothetical protein